LVSILLIQIPRFAHVIQLELHRWMKFCESFETRTYITTSENFHTSNPGQVNNNLNNSHH